MKRYAEERSLISTISISSSSSSVRGGEEEEEQQRLAGVPWRTPVKDVDARDAEEPSVDSTTPGPPVRAAGTECAGSAVSSVGPRQPTTRGAREPIGFAPFATRSRESMHNIRHAIKKETNKRIYTPYMYAHKYILYVVRCNSRVETIFDVVFGRTHRYILELIASSANANKDRTMADWYCPLRVSENSTLLPESGYTGPRRSPTIVSRPPRKIHRSILSSAASAVRGR